MTLLELFSLLKKHLKLVTVLPIVCALEVTSCTPWTPRPLMRRRKPSHESYDSVSTTDSPSTRRQPPSSQPIAVTTAVEATRPSRLHLT